MGRKIQKDLIFPGEIFNCELCHQQNIYFIIVKPSGVVVQDAVLCPHTTKITKMVRREDVKHFLNVEKREAEKNLQATVDDEKRKNIMQFISNVNAALTRLKVY